MLVPPPPHVWLNDNLRYLRHFGEVKRNEMKIKDNVIGPQPPVLKPWEWLCWCMGKSIREIEDVGGSRRQSPRLLEFDAFHYPNGRANMLVGIENLDYNTPAGLIREFITEWHDCFDPREIDRWGRLHGPVWACVACFGGMDQMHQLLDDGTPYRNNFPPEDFMGPMSPSNTGKSHGKVIITPAWAIQYVRASPRVR